jgi:alpha-beta hydrolase superfamily lysophospholipase
MIAPFARREGISTGSGLEVAYLSGSALGVTNPPRSAVGPRHRLQAFGKHLGGRRRKRFGVDDWGACFHVRHHMPIPFWLVLALTDSARVVERRVIVG